MTCQRGRNVSFLVVVISELTHRVGLFNCCADWEIILIMFILLITCFTCNVSKTLKNGTNNYSTTCTTWCRISINRLNEAPRLTWYIDFNWAPTPPKYRVNILTGCFSTKNLWKKDPLCEFVEQTKHLLGAKSSCGNWTSIFFSSCVVLNCDFKPMTVFFWTNAALLKNRRPKRCTGATEPVFGEVSDVDGKSASDVQILLDTCHGTLFFVYMQFLGRSLFGTIFQLLPFVTFW